MVRKSLLPDRGSMKFLSASAFKELGEAVGDDSPCVTQFNDPSDILADRTDKFVVKTRRGRQFFLIVSNPEYPSTVTTAVRNLQMARNALDNECRQAIETPLLHGFWGSTSYALWLYRSRLSEQRGLRFLQKRLLFPKIVAWLRRASQLSKRPCHRTEDLIANFLQPLEYVASNPRLGEAIKASAKEALGRIVRRDVMPVNVLQHGDLWLGNILLERPGNVLTLGNLSFRIVDWGAATERGYPLFDCIKFARSCGISPAHARPSILGLSDDVPCKPKDAMLYLLCGLGHLGRNLNCFPEHRFVDLCGYLFEYLEAAGLSLTKYLGGASDYHKEKAYRQRPRAE
jgi:hypothetical protein